MIQTFLKRQQGQQFIAFVFFGVCLALGMFLLHLAPSSATIGSPFTPKVHPLPSSLAQWSDPEASGDYFEEIERTPAGYLVWSRFPVRVYLEPVREKGDERGNQWMEAIHQAMREWGEYLPLVEVEKPDQADIVWLRSRPPIRPTLDRDNRRLIIPHSRNAEASYEFDFQDNTLIHRFTIQLTPHQSPHLTLGTARHELGHALGIWGHSPLEGDALYSTQVRTPPPISPRDVNTLKKIYQQPTLLGWRMEQLQSN
ncbi:peptidase [Spirulina subsalsa FACHB-351]|uniref:Peptidase n=1 Tax=Spirulina subsalsa FACHB-351 TaxID=234711 RepID=A0ABT3L9X2_9CYAN|nr:peptidase [Spirulina subsalsa FACHB-351]